VQPDDLDHRGEYYAAVAQLGTRAGPDLVVDGVLTAATSLQHERRRPGVRSSHADAASRRHRRAAARRVPAGRATMASMTRILIAATPGLLRAAALHRGQP
jgi:hypothetical protein